MRENETEYLEHHADLSAAIGELDLRRNLQLRAFMGLVLTPVFRDLQPRLRYAEMGRRGVTPMQYYAEFESHPAEFGYGDRFGGHYRVRLCRSVSEDRREPTGEVQRIERLILETRATLTGHAAIGAPASLGFEPSLGEPAKAGTGRVLHVLSRPNNPPGQRSVTEIPDEIAFLEPQDLDGPYPTITRLSARDDGFAAIEGAVSTQRGNWGLAHSDVYQHIHAREYIAGMEHGITAALTAASLPVGDFATRRARIIFRRPSFVGQAYGLGVRLYRRGTEIVALGAFHASGEDPFGEDRRADVYLRFEGRLT